MKILITGAAGTLGRNLAAYLHDAGEKDLWSAVRPGREAACVDPSKAVAFDLLNKDLVSSAILKVKPDCIYHLAASVDVQASFSAPHDHYRTNLNGTLELLEAMRAHAPRARLVVVSTSHVYGAQRSYEKPLDEDNPLNPVSPYAASKLAAEQAALLYHRTFGISAIVVRPFNIIGAGEAISSVAAALAQRVAAIARGEAKGPLKVGNLKAERDFIAIDDAMEGLTKAMASGKSGEAYNLCTGRGTPISEILDQIIARAGVKLDVEVDPALLRPVDPPRVVGSPEKLARDTGFRANRPLGPAIDSLCDYWLKRR